MKRKIDLVVFGATGFTGKYTVEEVHRITKKDEKITWAIAGRSQSKLEKVLKDLQMKTGDDLRNIEIIIADVGDVDSLKNMTNQVKVVVNCCGPFKFYGEPVVKACIETQTNYVDASAEIMFIEKMQLDYNESAQKAGVYIVSACAFASIPVELGIAFLDQNFKGKINTVENYLKTTININLRDLTSPSVHYGTWESLLHEFSDVKKIEKLHYQLYPKKLSETLPKLKKRLIMHKCEYDDLWCLPLLGPDKPNVYRTQRYLYENTKKRPIQFDHYVGFPSIFSAVLVMLFAGFAYVMLKFEYGKKLLLKYPRAFSFGNISHEGPSEKKMNETKFSMLLCAEGWDESDDVDKTPPTKKMRAKVSGTNPGYGVTCTCLIYSAITILKESDKMPGNGGVIAPGAAFYKTNLIKNLNDSGLIFEIVN